jgi:hypothetical protein
VFIQKWPICPLSALREKIYPRNIDPLPLEDPELLIGAVKFFEGLDPNPIGLFLDGHQACQISSGWVSPPKMMYNFRIDHR